MKKYVYGGYLDTGGTLDNGTRWSGFAVLLGQISDDCNVPMFGRCVSASGKNTDIEDVLASLTPGTHCKAYFGMPDAKGRVKLESLVPCD